MNEKERKEQQEETIRSLSKLTHLGLALGQAAWAIEKRTHYSVTIEILGQDYRLETVTAWEPYLIIKKV